MAKSVSHYLKDGTKYSGSTHKMPNGDVHSGSKHTSKSKKLFHFSELPKVVQRKIRKMK